MIVSAFIALGSIIRPIDLAVYKKFYLNQYLSNYSEQLNNNENDEINKEINDKIIFIDIPTTDDKDWLEKLRSDVAGLLFNIDSKVDSTESDLDKPVVILDIAFGSETVGLRPIKDAIMSLRDKKIKVYAPYELPPPNTNTTFKEHDKYQNKSLYNIYFEGQAKRLNTAFHNHIEVDGLLSYYSFERIENMMIESLPVRVAKDYNRIEKKADSTELDYTQYVVPLKLPFNPASRKEIYFVYTNDSSSTANNNFSNLKDSFDLSKKFIIIGTPKDQQEIGKDGGIKYLVPGPYIVATALIDQLHENKFTKPPYDNVVFQLILILFFAFFVCLIFAAIYKYIKKLQTSPSLIALLSWVLGVTIFFGLGYLLLEFVVIRPTLPAISMFWATLLAWHFTKKFLVTGIMEGSGKYDVFISYSRSKSEWVKKNLYSPLNELRKPDGSKLNIFFDEKSIGIGENFTTYYMRKIVDSKLFIPVMSQDYYGKNHCRNEMDIAVKRKVEKLIGIFMITFDYKHVPEEFTHINFVDLDKGVDFMSLLKKELIKLDNNQTSIESNSNEVNSNSIQIEDKSYSTEVDHIPKLVEKPSESNTIISKGDNLGIGNENKVWIDSKDLVEKGVESELLDKGIIIINNSAGELTLNASGVTLTINDKNNKKGKKNKKVKKEKIKTKKKRKKKDKKKAKKALEKKVIKHALKKIKKQLAKKAKKKRKK